MAGTATTILIDGTPTNGADRWTDSLVGGGAWIDGNGGTVTIQWTAFQGTMDGQNSYGWTPVALAGLREALSLWESVANIDFVEVSGAENADVKFWWGTETQAGGPGVLGWSDLPGFENYYEYPTSEVRDVLFNAQDSSFSGALGKGSLGLVTMVHEIGHLLGLAHPHDGGAAPDATTFDQVEWGNPYDMGNGGLNQGIYTTMSYNFGWPSYVTGHTAESWGWTYGPMGLDIAAIQEIYGANTTYASGDNVYALSTKTGPGTYWASIWDTGGIDTISAVGASSNTTIDLRAPTDALDSVVLASFSYYYGDTLGGYTIARGVVIENAIGGNSNDRLYGNEVSNRLEGGAGDDQLDGREGADTMIGGAGGDYYYVDDIGDVIVELDNSGIDGVISTFDYTLGANLENLSLQGNWGPLRGKGNSAANIITGNEDDNILEGAGGADTLNGRDGNDRLVVSDLSFAKVDGGAGVDTLALDGAGLVLDLTNPSTAAKLQSMERIDLTGTGDNTLLVDQWRVFSIGAVVGFKRVLIVEGNDGDKVKFFEPTWTYVESFTNADGTFDRWTLGNSELQVERAVSPKGVTIIGTAGDDIISTTFTVPGQPLATALGDTIDGGLGADMMTGGGGDDVYIVDSAGDRTIEAAGGGIDLVRSSISWTLGDNVENLELLAGAANGTGNGLANRITGNAGENTLDGGLNADDMIGGLGNDTYVVDHVGDFVIEGAGGGIDTVLSSITYSLWANFENLTLTGSGAISGYGNDLDNWLTGNAGVNTLAGGMGNDTYVMDSMADTIVENTGAGADTVRASVSYTLGPNLENLVLTGTAAIDGTGNPLKNILTGNAGNNVLDGGVGNDTMSGGLGDDTYVVDVAGDVAAEGVNEGTDTVNAWLGWTLGANLERLRLMGTADLNGTGNTLDNALFGNVGKNLLNGGAGADTMTGGLGDDTYVVDQSGDVVIELASQGTDTVNASIDWTLGDNVENLVLRGESSIKGTGNGLRNVLTGNSGNNVLDGGANSDTMAGGLGNDTYVVDATGDVVIEAENEGNDLVRSNIDYTLGANLERLTLTGVSHIAGTGNELRNTLIGNAGNNVLDGGAGNDTMTGGLGDDTYVVDAVGDAATEGAGAGTDTVNAWIDWTLSANFERLRLMGTADLNGSGNGQGNALFGNAGKNILNGSAGADTMTGGLGDDTYVVDQSDDGVVEAGGGGIDLVRSSADVYQLGANVENLILTGTRSINGTGNGLRNVLTGNTGNNVLDGGANADTMTGGAGNDTYIVGDRDDVVVEVDGGGVDTVLSSVTWALGAALEKLTLTGTASRASGNELNNSLTGNASVNVLDGGAGADMMAGGGGSDTYVVDQSGDIVIEAENAGIDLVRTSVSYALSANVENLTLLGSEDLRGTGNALGNTLLGNDGDNILNGGAGLDRMEGGLGDDTYIVDRSGDVVKEAAAAGIDTVQSSLTWTLGANLENLILAGSTRIDGTGNELANVLTGNGAGNILDGRSGADTMIGGSGDDIYVVENAGDLVVELAAGGTDMVQAWISYALTANVEELKLYGTADIDATGNGLANVVTGNAGHNILDGGLGADTLRGGGGGDTFRFSTALGPDNVDRILSFDHAADSIQLDHSIFAALGTGALAAEAFNKGSVATQADDRILFDAGSKSLYYDADGMGGVDAVKFATVKMLAGGFSHTDFLIV